MNRYSWKTGSLEAVMALIALIFLFPVYLMVNMAIRPTSDLSSPVLPTQEVTFDNFTRAWNTANLGGAILNSLIVTVLSVLLLLIIASMASYALVRITSRWSSVAFYVFMIGLLLPFQLGLIPLYQTMRDLNFVGNVLPLVIIYVGLRIPFSMFLFVQFLREIPTDYEEAAAIDGASAVKTFWHIVLPLIRPVTGTVAILNALFVWNDFLIPLLYLSGTRNQTIPVAIYSFVGEYYTEWQVVFSALIMGSLPVFLAFFFIQRSLIQGLASGIKG